MQDQLESSYQATDEVSESMKTKTRKPRTSRSLTATLTIAFLVLSVAILSISSGLQIFSNIATQQEAVAGKLQLNAQDASRQVSNFIQNKFSIMETAARLTNLMRMAPDEQQQVLDGLLGRDVAFRQVAALNTQDQEVAKSSRLSKLASGSLAAQISGDALAQIKQGNQYISPVYVDPETSEPLVLVAMPVANALGEFQGILAAEVNLKFMWDLVDQLRVGESGVAYVVDKQGNLIAFNDTARVLRGDNVAKLDEVSEYITGGSVIPFLDLTTGIQGIPVVGAYAPLGKPDWAVITEMPWYEAYRDLIQNGIVSGVTLIVMAVLVGLLGVYLARRLTVPLVSLTNTASQISAGELDLQANVRGPTEVAQLATSFNSMTTQLRSLITGLEERVEARTEQLRASADVGRAVTSILEPDQLLKQVVELITERFGFYYTAIFIVDEPSQTAVLRAATGEAGHALLELHHRLPVDEKSMVGSAIVTHNARIALDVGQEAVRFANPLLPNTRSEIALPLRIGERAIGALDAQSDQAGAFDEAGAQVLQAMADQIAVALFNAEIFNRSQRQAQTLALLNQLSRDLALATSLEAIAQATTRAVTSLIGEQRVAIATKTVNPRILSLREFLAASDQPVGESQPVQVAQSLIGECFLRGTTIYSAEMGSQVDRYQDVAMVYRLGLRSSVIIPLRVGDRISGTFNVSSDKIDAYTPEQIAQLEQVAAQLAVAMENLNLTQQAQAALADLDAANRRLISQAWARYAQASDFVAGEWRDGEWITLDDRARRTAESQALTLTSDMIQLPVKVRGEAIGEFSLSTDESQQGWDQEDLAFAQALIDQVGQIIENARLLEETERLAQREQLIRQITTRIRAAGDMQSVLEATTAGLARSLGVSRAIMRLTLGDDSTQQEIQASEQTDVVSR